MYFIGAQGLKNNHMLYYNDYRCVVMSRGRSGDAAIETNCY